MKIYTSTIDIALPSPKRFWVAPHSDFKIGVKIVKNGVPAANEFTVKAGSTALTPDDDKVDGFTTYTISSGATGFVEYDVEVAGAVQKQKILQIVTDSTVFEVGGAGGSGDLSQYAKKTWVEEQISSFVTEDALSDFITAEDLTAYATEDELTAYATKAELTGYVENGDLTAYYTKSETSSAAEISAAIAGGGGGGDSYTKAETDALLSAKADATKQLPVDLTSWITDGWHYYDENEGQSIPFTELTTGFYDISPYCDYTVSAQYVYGWNGYYYTTYLFSYCTNGKTVFCHQLDGRDVMNGTDYEGNISGNPSCYFEVDTTKIPNGSGLAEYLWDSSVVDEGSVKWFAYVSQNMDGSAPYTLQELSTFGDNNPVDMGDQNVYHNATEEVTPGFVEVSAVYSNETSSFVEGQQLNEILNDRLANYVDWDSMSGYPTYDDLTAYYTKSETSSAAEIETAFTGKVTNLSSVSGIMKISQADYDVLSAGGTADANTLYVIV